MPAVLLHGLPQKELGKELELELVPFLRRGTGGGTSSYFWEGTGTGTSSFLKGTFNCLLSPGLFLGHLTVRYNSKVGLY